MSYALHLVPIVGSDVLRGYTPEEIDRRCDEVDRANAKAGGAQLPGQVEAVEGASLSTMNSVKDWGWWTFFVFFWHHIHYTNALDWQCHSDIFDLNSVLRLKQAIAERWILCSQVVQESVNQADLIVQTDLDKASR